MLVASLHLPRGASGVGASSSSPNVGFSSPVGIKGRLPALHGSGVVLCEVGRCKVGIARQLVPVVYSQPPQARFPNDRTVTACQVWPQVRSEVPWQPATDYHSALQGTARTVREPYARLRRGGGLAAPLRCWLGCFPGCTAPTLCLLCV